MMRLYGHIWVICLLSGLFIAANINCSTLADNLQTDNLNIMNKNPYYHPTTVGRWMDRDGKPSRDLLDLLALLKIPHDGTLENIVAVTQKGPHQWLRPPDKERWQLEERVLEHSEETSQKLRFLLKNLGYVEQVDAHYKQYDYSVVLGATASTMRKRCAYLLEQWNNGVRWNVLVFLGGARPLDPERESPDSILGHDNKLPVCPAWQLNRQVLKTESDMIRLLWDSLDLPPGLAQVPVFFIDTPLQIRSDGSMRRPTTADTLYDWLKLCPKAGKCLFISSQPQVGYQESVILSVMPEDFTIDVIGPRAKEDELVAIYLDSAARLLYQELLRLNARRT